MITQQIVVMNKQFFIISSLFFLYRIVVIKAKFNKFYYLFQMFLKLKLKLRMQLRG